MAIDTPASLTLLLLTVQISLLYTSTPCTAATGSLRSCNTSTGDMYFDSKTNSCRTCTNCSELGYGVKSSCSAHSDTICSCPSEHFFNQTSSTCTQCTSCSRFVVHSECTETSDRVCKCPPNYHINFQGTKCSLNCSLCPNKGGCRTENQCNCPSCRIGPLCEDRDPQCGPEDTTSTPPDTRATVPTEGSGFSPVSSALIAVGAVFGIIIFSACFVLLGVASTCCRRNNHTSSYDSSSSQESNISNNVGNHHGQSSVSLASLYINGHSPSPTQEYKTSLDLLRYSNSSLYSNSWNALRTSPKSCRSSSVPLYLMARHQDSGSWTPV